MIDRYDPWLAADGPVALAFTERLESAQSADAAIFPPTYAPFAKGDPPSYIIDDTGQGKVALIDSVGSQANRMEPIFKLAPYDTLVPKATVTVNERTINLLDAGHRAADAVVRFSSKRDDLAQAFRQIADEGSSLLLAKIAPTSLVFGAWDSRGTGVKLPRIVGATIRAYGVEQLSRAAQYLSVIKKEEADSIGLLQDALSEQGLSDAPAGKTLGGVVARKGIQREALLNLVALRSLSAGSQGDSTKLQRYILGLALVAITAPWKSYLREGCLLVAANGADPVHQVVHRNGVREPGSLDGEKVFDYAKLAADDFGIGAAWTATFEPASVTNAVTAAETRKAAKAKKQVKP